jgi:hypothetical protein
MPACAFECPPLDAAPHMTASERSSFRGRRLPTPTETGNALAPSMQKWPAYARLQRLFGTGGHLPASVAAWQMGLTTDWLEQSALALTSAPQPMRGECSEH